MKITNDDLIIDLKYSVPSCGHSINLGQTKIHSWLIVPSMRKLSSYGI